MAKNADRDRFEASFVAEHNQTNPDDPIFAVGSKEEIDAWVARLASRERKEERTKGERRFYSYSPRLMDGERCLHLTLDVI